VIPLALAIVSSVAVGVGAEHRYGDAALAAVGKLLRLVLWVAVPFVAFVNLNALELKVEVGAGIAYGWVALVCCMTLAYLVGKLVLRLPRPSVGSLMLSSTIANTGYLGLPLTVALFGRDQLPSGIAYDSLVSALSLVTVGFSVAAAFGTVATNPRERAIAFLARNPPLWATAAAFVAPHALAPQWLVDVSQGVVLAIVPLGFFAVGVTLAHVAEEGVLAFPPPLTPPVAVGIAIKTLVAPAIVLTLSTLVLKVPDPYVSQAAMASGINGLAVAQEYGLDRQLVAALIAWTTAIALVWGLAVALL
jgi:predicted permease